MKKILSMLLVLVMLQGYFAVMAEMGVQIIGGPETETEPVSLDDLKLNIDAEIEGWGTLIFTSYEQQGALGFYRPGKNKVVDSNADYHKSGQEADYAVIYADILNTTMSARNYLENVSVKAVYDDAYEYAGWAYQRNYDNKKSDYAAVAADKGKQNIRWVIDKADYFAIDPMYQGHYIFGCTLPNAAFEGTKPLKMIISIDGNEITYNIRK